jgi:hypothetical protein
MWPIGLKTISDINNISNIYSAPLAAVSDAYHSLVCRDPVRLSGNLPQLTPVCVSAVPPVSGAHKPPRRDFAGDAKMIVLVFADSAPEFDSGTHSFGCSSPTSLL